MKYEPHKSSLFDLDANIVALLVYLIPLLLGFIDSVLESIVFLVPLVVFFMEKKSEFVLFHASNALAFFAINCIISIISIGLNLPLVLTSWMSNVFVLGIFYNGFAILFLIVIGIVFGIINLVLFACELISLVKAYQYQDITIPGITKITKFIMTLKK